MRHLTGTFILNIEVEDDTTDDQAEAEMRHAMSDLLQAGAEIEIEREED